MKTLTQNIITALGLVLIVAAPACAEGDAYLHGSVIDANNNPVAAAKLRIGDHEFITKHDGKYYFDRLAPGSYTLHVEVKGKSVQQDVVLEAGHYTDQLVVFAQAVPRVQFQNAQGAANEILANVGINSYASVSPKDGTLAVEVLSAQTHKFDIWHLEPSGKKLGVLVETADDDQNPRWSPDGMQLIFHRQSPDRGYEVWIKNLKNDTLKRVDAGLTPAWSPDGHSVVYAKKVQDNWDIYTQQLETGRVTRLTHDISREQYPYWAKLGGEEQIVFASNKSGIYEIWSMRPDGTNPRRLSSAGQLTGNRMIGPVVSADGQKIAFWEIDYKHDHSVWVMRYDGGGQTEIQRNAANPEWAVTATGQYMLYFDSKITGRAQIWRSTLSNN